VPRVEVVADGEEPPSPVLTGGTPADGALGLLERLSDVKSNSYAGHEAGAVIICVLHVVLVLLFVVL